MTYPQQHQTPIVPGTMPPNNDWSPTPVPPERKSRLLPVLLVLLVVSILGVIALVMAAALGGSGKPNTPPAAQPAAEDAAAPAAPAADTPKAGHSPKVTEFALTPKVTDKECFGSAGCNVGVKVDVTYAGPALSDDDTWLITYEITGDEDGPAIGSLELTGTVYEVNDEFLQTKTSKTKISIKVTDVEKVGL